MNKFITFRKKIFYEYKKNLNNIKNLTLVDFEKNISPSFHLILLNFSKKNSLKFKEKLLINLKKNKIYAQYHYIPIYMFKIFKQKIYLKKTKEFYYNTISLPVYFNLKIKDVKKICNCLKIAFEKQ